MKDIEKVNPNANLPAHLQERTVQGMDDLKKIVRPSVIKMVQKQSDDKLIDKYGTGTALVMPAEAILASKGEAFLFTPLFFFREFCTWTPIESRGKLPAVLERTFDPDSPLARKATGGPELWNEEIEYQGQRVKVRHVEHLNFLVAIQGDHPLAGEVMVLSFSKGEHRTGMNFASLLKMRKASPFYCVFEATVPNEPRSNEKGSWYGFDIGNPTNDEAWIPENQVEKFESLFTEFKEMYAQSRVVVAYDDENDEPSVPENDEI